MQTLGLALEFLLSNLLLDGVERFEAVQALRRDLRFDGLGLEDLPAREQTLQRSPAGPIARQVPDVFQHAPKSLVVIRLGAADRMLADQAQRRSVLACRL